MKKLSILLMFIAQMACIACQRQQREQRKNSESPREMQERAAAEDQAQEQQEPTKRDSIVAPGASPEKPHLFKSQAQKFQPRRTIPMASPLQAKVPQGILEPILNKAAELAKVAPEQLVIVRAEPAAWNDSSLGCPEPGIIYTQALVNGYWVVIGAAGKNYDFRVDGRGNFRLCALGQGRPPSPVAPQ
jgi:hypothetical protein